MRKDEKKKKKRESHILIPAFFINWTWHCLTQEIVQLTTLLITCSSFPVGDEPCLLKERSFSLMSRPTPLPSPSASLPGGKMLPGGEGQLYSQALPRCDGGDGQSCLTYPWLPPSLSGIASSLLRRTRNLAWNGSGSGCCSALTRAMPLRNLYAFVE